MGYKTAALTALVGASQALELNVASSGGNRSTLTYGVMFEDINHSGDGGMYAELVQNRAFQGSEIFPSDLTAWRSVGGSNLALQNLTDPLSWALLTSMRVSTSSSTSDQVGFLNEGWWGMDVKVQQYFYVKGSYDGIFTVSLQSNLTDEVFGSVEVRSAAIPGEWTKHEYLITPDIAAPNSNNTLVVTFDKAGAQDGYLDFNLISLFPPTYKNRANGMRIDLMETLAELNPSYLRFPGGNMLEGNSPPYLWKWNETIGDLTQRPGFPGVWQYSVTNGLGLIEYLHWCEDLGMEPILGVWAGLYLDGTELTREELRPWVQYALEELEFLMGDSSTPYGAQRIALGYPDPFPINFVERMYNEYRFPMFYDALHAAYPDITIIASTIETIATQPNDTSSGDFHLYTRPDDFVEQFGFFDNFTLQHPIIVGEYAIVQPNIPEGGTVDWDEPRLAFPNWIGSVAEAIFLLGTERNGNKIFGNFYAPQFQSLNAYQWTPDQVAYTADPDQTVRSTSHYVSKLFSGTRITEILPVDEEVFGPAYFVAGKNGETGQYVVKAAVYNSTEDVPFAVTFDGVSAGIRANLTYLTAPDGFSNNDIGVEIVEVTTEEVVANGASCFEFSLPELSVAVFATEAEGVMGHYNRHPEHKWGEHGMHWEKEWHDEWNSRWGGKGRGHHWKA